jgi:hypothetical protein
LINLWAIKNHRYIVHKDQRWCSHGEGQEHWLLPGRSLLCQLDGGPGRWTHRPHHGLGRVRNVRNVRNVRIVFEKVELWWAMFYLFIDVDRLHTHNTHTHCVCLCSIVFFVFKVLFSYFSFGCLLCSDVGNGWSGRWSRKARLWNFPLSDFQGAGSHGPWVPGSIHEKKSKLGDFQTDQQHMIFNEFRWAN